jgi:nicotinamidase-related amidase
LFAPGASTSAFVPELAPGPQDLVLVKATGGAFSRTKLDDELRSRGIDTLIVAGFMTHLAVLTTANDGSSLGYRVLVAADATATRTLPGAIATASIDAKNLQRASLATLADRVADVLSSAAITKLPVVR